MKEWEKAYRQWRKLADAGYGPRTNTPEGMRRVDERIRKAKARYEELLKKSRQETLDSITHTPLG